MLTTEQFLELAKGDAFAAQQLADAAKNLSARIQSLEERIKQLEARDAAKTPLRVVNDGHG